MSPRSPGLTFVSSLVLLALTPSGDESHVFKCGNAQNGSDPRSVTMGFFKQELEERTAGRIQVENYFGGILGTEREMAEVVATKLVWIMSFRKEMIIFGYNGAEVWNANKGAWKNLIVLLEPAPKRSTRRATRHCAVAI